MGVGGGGGGPGPSMPLCSDYDGAPEGKTRQNMLRALNTKPAVSADLNTLSPTPLSGVCTPLTICHQGSSMVGKIFSLSFVHSSSL